MLSDRELDTDAIRSVGGVKVVERADAPTAKQVAVIWVQEDGLAPLISGFFLILLCAFIMKARTNMYLWEGPF